MKRTLDDILYPAVLCAAAVLAAAVLVYVRWFSHIPLPTCWIYEELHLYCPGCGCTRAFEALLRGDILRSLRYNAAVCYFAAGVTVYLLTQKVQRLSRGKLRCGLHYRNIYLHLGFGLLLGNALVWNVLWHGFGITM